MLVNRYLTAGTSGYTISRKFSTDGSRTKKNPLFYRGLFRDFIRDLYLHIWQFKTVTLLFIFSFKQYCEDKGKNTKACEYDHRDSVIVI